MPSLTEPVELPCASTSSLTWTSTWVRYTGLWRLRRARTENARQAQATVLTIMEATLSDLIRPAPSRDNVARVVITRDPGGASV